MAILDVLMRYLHIVSAVLAVGGAFLMLIGVPAGLKLIDDEARRLEVMLKIRRAFKMTVHPAILGLLVSGVYNTIRLWPTYKLNMGRHHMFWGPHLLLGLTVIVFSLWLLAGKSLRNNHRKWLKINVTLMLVTILLASALRSVRISTVNEKWEQDKAELQQLKAATMPAVAPAIPETSPTTQPAIPQ
jgi:uncharacterized membrane protein